MCPIVFSQNSRPSPAAAGTPCDTGPPSPDGLPPSPTPASVPGEDEFESHP